MSFPPLGIDIAKKDFVVHLIQQDKHAQRTFANKASAFPQLTTWLQRHAAPQVHACLEATGNYGLALAQYLHTTGHIVSIVNPARIRYYAQSKLQRNKTDGLDAALIADFCVTQQPEPWIPLSASQQELQAVVRHRDALQKMRTQEANRLDDPGLSASVKALIQKHLAFIDQQIQELEQRMQQCIDQDPQLKRQHQLLDSIKGIGPLSAAQLLSCPLHHFATGREAAAYAGLSPSQRISGSSVRGKSKASKIGDARLRKYLYLPAIVAMTHDPAMQALRARLLKKGKHHMPINVAAMRKLLCVAIGVLKSGKPYDPDWASSLPLAP